MYLHPLKETCKALLERVVKCVRYTDALWETLKNISLSNFAGCFKISNQCIGHMKEKPQVFAKVRRRTIKNRQYRSGFGTAKNSPNL